MDAKQHESLRLMQQIHTQRLESAKSDVSKLSKFVQDYEQLQATLAALPAHTHHQALLPLGAAAFVPGSVVHTNELLVLLGDGWLVERSCEQARDIAARRLADCRTKLKAAEAAVQVQGHWLDRTELTVQEEGQDIVEEVTEEEYLRQKARHHEMVKAHRQQLREERDKHTKQPQRKGHKEAPTSGNPATATATAICSSSSSSSSSAKKPDAARDEPASASEKMKQLFDDLEVLERDEDSDEELETNGDAGDSDSDSDDSDSDECGDSDDAGDKPDNDDSEDDIPADLNKFRHVKIESPMPSIDRKFMYSEDHSDELGDISKVEESIRGRTRSFTRSVASDGCYFRSNSHEKDNSESDSASEDKTGMPSNKAPAMRRVSWADQSSFIGSEDVSNAIKIRYVASAVTERDRLPTQARAPSCESGQSALDGTEQTCALEAKDAGDNNITVNSPADLVKLAVRKKSGESPENVTTADEEVGKSVDETTSGDTVVAADVTSVVSSSSGTSKRRSILKNASSEDAAVMPCDAGAIAESSSSAQPQPQPQSWLNSSESVPITNVQHDEPLPPPVSPPPAGRPAFTNRIVMRDPATAASEPPTAPSNPKKMSKFKASRLGK